MGMRGAQPRGNNIRFSPSPSIQGQEGRGDRQPRGRGVRGGGAVSDKSGLCSPSPSFCSPSPPRVRRGIKAQLLRGMRSVRAVKRKGEEKGKTKLRYKNTSPSSNINTFTPSSSPVTDFLPRPRSVSLAAYSVLTELSVVVAINLGSPVSVSLYLTSESCPSPLCSSDLWERPKDTADLQTSN